MLLIKLVFIIIVVYKIIDLFFNDIQDRERDMEGPFVFQFSSGTKSKNVYRCEVLFLSLVQGQKVKMFIDVKFCV